MNWVLKAEGLGKEYILRHQEAPRYASLRDVISDGARDALALLQGSLARRSKSIESFWALRDISFEVTQGERIGIIGRNGAGKSTLLKILSRITDPTTGRVVLKGKVASLLEVGTGFHPELTGRENIFLNGAILGMAKAEILRQFDEIVAFAGVEKFLDTPVKRYSSGMYVRLAFAVAAHLDTEVLIVDEVLAVGDLEFQKKCIGRMEDISRAGRTLLFVSHSMSTITSLCNRCVLLDAGRIVADGAPSKVILSYYGAGATSPAVLDMGVIGRRVGDGHAELLGGGVEDITGRTLYEPDLGQPFVVKMRYRIFDSDRVKSVPNFHFYRADATCAFIAASPDIGVAEAGEYVALCCVPGHFLNDGAYFVGLALTSYGDLGYTVNFYERSALSFNVRDRIDPGRYGYGGPIPGAVRPMLDWKIERTA
jgi:lipopolysaccharide transport system ATP-binding protein